LKLQYCHISVFSYKNSIDNSIEKASRANSHNHMTFVLPPNPPSSRNRIDTILIDDSSKHEIAYFSKEMVLTRNYRCRQ